MRIVRPIVVISVVLVCGASTVALAQDRGGRERVAGFVPIGLVVPWPPLPLPYALLGSPYDDGVNGVYGVYGAPAPGGYVVVPPPPRIDEASSTPPPLLRSASNPLQPIVYPRAGQSAEQTIADRRACNAWANAQPFSARDLTIYRRAIAACLDGRGYTVR